VNTKVRVLVKLAREGENASNKRLQLQMNIIPNDTDKQCCSFNVSINYDKKSII